MKIYNVYQSGKRLYIDEKEIPDNKIVVNKYDNMQQTLRLISDGTLPPRLYWALRNPKLSNKYFILKLINNEDLIVGTDISAYTGLWDMLLIGTDEDYIIEGADIDQSRLTYVSDHFGRLFVRDNFLEELDFEEQCSPTFKIFYDEIMFRLDNIPDLGDIPDKLSDLENDTNFISGVALKDDGEGHVEIIGTTFSGGETEEGEIPSGGSVEVDDKLDEESTNPVQNQVIAKEVNSLKQKDESLDKEVIALRERNAELEETIEKLQIKTTTSPSPFHHITDSANMKVVDFGMEGKTEQYTGTITDDEGNEVTVPNPTHPQDIKLAGVLNEETGRYEHKCCVGNKNLLDCTAITNLSQNTNTPTEYSFDDGVLTLIRNDGTYNQMAANYRIYLIKGIRYTIHLKEAYATLKEDISNNVKPSAIWLGVYMNGTRLAFVANNVLSFTSTESGFADVSVSIFKDSKPLVKAELHDFQMVYGNVTTDFIPHASQQFTLTSPVPLTKWDKLVKRDGVWGWSVKELKWVLVGGSDENWEISNSFKGFKIQIFPFNMASRYGFCNQFKVGSIGNLEETVIQLGAGNDYAYTSLNKFYDDTLEDKGLANWKAHLAENPLEIVTYSDEEQAFIPLPDEEQTLLNNLETYYGVTNVYNEQGCPMWLCYACDSKLYVDQKLEQINNALLSLGANV